MLWFLVFNIYASISVFFEESVVLKGYNNKIENKNYVWQSSFENNTYFYDSGFDNKYVSNKHFKKIENNFEDIVALLDKINYDEIEHTVSNIKEIMVVDDYFYLVDNSDKELNFRFYFYDISEHTLYYIKICE